VLLAADRVAHAEIARRFSISRQTVINWRARYESVVRSRPCSTKRRPRTLDRGQLITVTLTPPPGEYAVTHWSSRLLARHLSIGYGTVARVSREHGVQPWRAETFKFSTDPQLVAKVTDMVGLYLAPPENAVVLCVDEKSQIQALDRTAPTLPMQIGILAFLKHLGRAYPDWELHLVMDNYATHKRQPVRDCLAENPRVKVHFTPTSALWIPRRGLVFNHRTPNHPPRHLPQRRRADRGHQGLHQRLEPARTPLRLDQDLRANPRQSTPPNNFKHAAART
jgi:transposase